MGLFDSINIAGSGVTVYRTWLDAISDNISNINDAVNPSQAAFQPRFVIAEEKPNGPGVQVGGVPLGNAEGRMVYEPGNPQANADGYVRYPDTDLAQQMGFLILAQRGYQANLAVVDRAHDAYQSAIQLGKNA